VEDGPIPGRIRGIEIDALDFIWEFQAKYKNSPNTSELMHQLSRSKDATLDILYRLEYKGYIELIHKKYRQGFLIVPLYKK
jgi:Mn-dependent DtxR family transcriptional regulator